MDIPGDNNKKINNARGIKIYLSQTILQSHRHLNNLEHIQK